jgi:hypothetical protein
MVPRNLEIGIKALEDKRRRGMIMQVARPLIRTSPTRCHIFEPLFFMGFFDGI